MVGPRPSRVSCDDGVKTRHDTRARMSTSEADQAFVALSLPQVVEEEGPWQRHTVPRVG